jgi:hypothetical protein
LSVRDVLNRKIREDPSPSIRPARQQFELDLAADETIGKKFSSRFRGLGRAAGWIGGLETGEPDNAAVIDRDVEPLVYANDARGPGRRATIRMDASAEPERQTGDPETQGKVRACAHDLFAETMRRTQFHARGFARSRRPRP